MSQGDGEVVSRCYGISGFRCYFLTEVSFCVLFISSRSAGRSKCPGFSTSSARSSKAE